MMHFKVPHGMVKMRMWLGDQRGGEAGWLETGQQDLTPPQLKQSVIGMGNKKQSQGMQTNSSGKDTSTDLAITWNTQRISESGGLQISYINDSLVCM